MSNIIFRRHLLERERSNHAKELMREYDETVYEPARKQLQLDCTSEGHGTKKVDWNGFGWNFENCTRCGALIRKWHDDERDSDDSV